VVNPGPQPWRDRPLVIVTVVTDACPSVDPAKATACPPIPALTHVLACRRGPAATATATIQRGRRLAYLRLTAAAVGTYKI